MDRPKTLVEKVWERHVVRKAEGEPDLLYVDLHMVHEVTSPQAFEGLRLAGRKVRRPDLTLATMDHNVPTTEIGLPIRDEISAKQMEALRRNCEEFGIETSEVEHVLATQTLQQRRPKTMAVTVECELPADVTAKDLMLCILNSIGTGG